jgi:hypothetical protein
MSTDKKLYAAIAVLAVLGGALFLTNKKEKEDHAAHTVAGQQAELPKVAITEEQTKGIDKIVISKPADGDGGAASEVVLVKEGEDWKMKAPVEAAANQANVKSLLDNLKALKPGEMIDSGKGSYDKYKVSDDKALHAVFTKGDTVILDAYFGESGGRGQMTRLAGKEGVFAMKGYSSYLYSRDVKGFRDLTIFKFEDTAVTSATIENEHGSFTFTKDGDKWIAKHKAPKAAGAKELEKFDDAKLKDMLRAYKGLNADGFAEKGKTAADLGLDKPVATVTFTLNDGAKREVKVGANAEGSSRWVQATGHEELLSISSWAADWATAEPKKFQKAEEKKDGDKAEGASEKKDEKKKAPAAPAPAAPAPPADPHAGHGH